MPSVVTANRLDNGRVVYLTPARDWSTRLSAARIEPEGKPDDVMARLGAEIGYSCEVIDVYALAVELADDRPRPVSVRERIRAQGKPTPEGTRRTGRR